MNTTQYLNLEEAAAFLKLSKTYVYKLRVKGKLKGYKPNGKTIYFKQSDLEKYIEGE